MPRGGEEEAMDSAAPAMAHSRILDSATQTVVDRELDILQFQCGLRLHLRARGQSAASSAPHPRRWPAARWPRCLGVRRSGRCLLSWSSFVSAAPKSTVAGLVAVMFLSAATSLTPYEISSHWTHTTIVPWSGVGKFFGV